MQDLRDLLNSIPKNKWNSSVRKQKEFIKFLSTKYPNIPSLNEQLYLFSNNLSSAPHCPVYNCKNTVNWINNDHYSNTCSKSCANKLRIQNGTLANITAKKEQTMLDRYGVTNPSKSNDIQEKRLSTMIEKYGAKVSNNSREKTRARADNLNKKGRETLMRKHGVSNAIKVPGAADKAKQTLLSNYNVSNPSQIEDVKRKRQEQTVSTWNELSSDTTIIEIIEPCQNLIDTFDNPNKRIKFICNRCNNIEILASETYKFRIKSFDNPCSACSQILSNSSRSENLIKEFIKSFGIEIIENDRKILNGKELDIYIPSLNVAIEYCGLYWHSEERISDRNYHKNKHILCKEQGIRLITIFEDEWINKPEIVKSRLMVILGKIQRKLMARKLIVKKIDNKVANEFVVDNHIQGRGSTSYAWGLFDNEEQLVSVLTVSELSRAKGSNKQPNTWELNRLCVLKNTTIIGGANKLFNAMIKELDPTTIISYSDNRWNTGNVYNILGFIQQSDTRINYWYIDFKNLKRIHRYALRKNNSDNSLLTEWENRQKQGITRIWDCGNTKWVWNKKGT